MRAPTHLFGVKYKMVTSAATLGSPKRLHNIDFSATLSGSKTFPLRESHGSDRKGKKAKTTNSQTKIWTSSNVFLKTKNNEAFKG